MAMLPFPSSWLQFGEGEDNLLIPLPTATFQSKFEQGVALTLHLWDHLSLAVENGWGGGDMEDKREWFAGAIVDLFPDVSKTKPAPGAPTEEPDQADVETVLLQVMFDEFETNVEDDSGYELAQKIMEIRAECLQGKFDLVDDLRRRWDAQRSKKVSAKFKHGQDQDDDTDWDTDDGDDDEEDDDIDMDEAPPLAPVAKEKPPPEVDEDGFTKVTRKKR